MTIQQNLYKLHNHNKETIKISIFIEKIYKKRHEDFVEKKNSLIKLTYDLT